MPNIGDYEATYSKFEWGTPQSFNFGRDVIDAHPAEKSAMIWLGNDGSEEHLTFGDFSRSSSKFANICRDLGVKKGDRVMVLMGKIPAWHTILTGLLKVGAVAIPCAPQLRVSDLEFRASHSGSVLLVADQTDIEEAEKARPNMPTVKNYVSLGADRDGWESYETLMDAASEDFDAEDTSASDNAFMLYTSGTTKHPKGVVQTHGFTHAKRMEAHYWLDLQEGDRLWCTSGTGWAKSIWNVFLGPWSLGTELFFHEGGFDTSERLDLIQKYDITVLCQAPTEYRLLTKTKELENADLSNLRHAVSAGEPLNAAVIERWKELHDITIYDGYGQTENTLLVGNFQGVEVRPGAMGKPSPGCEIEIVDLDGNPCPDGETGDVALAGEPPVLFRGYWEQPEETESCYRGSYYLTGDRAYRDSDGYLWFVGRSDDVILSAGYRIGPFEVESALIEHEAVVESAVVGIPDEDRGSIVKAFVVLGKDYSPSDELIKELQDFCKRQTAPYKYPRKVEFVEDLPKTTSGKIRRVELRQKETR